LKSYRSPPVRPQAAIGLLYPGLLGASTLLAYNLAVTRPQVKQPPTGGKKTKKPSKALSIPEKVTRLLEIYTLIAQGRHPSVALLMDRLGISKRTVFRYLRIIDTIDRITYDPTQGGYTFVEGNRADKLRLSHDELAVVLAAGEAVSHLGKSFGERFRRLIGNLDLALEPESGA
jgi:hypothetical protein